MFHLIPVFIINIRYFKKKDIYNSRNGGPREEGKKGMLVGGSSDPK